MTIIFLKIMQKMPYIYPKKYHMGSLLNMSMIAHVIQDLFTIALYNVSYSAVFIKKMSYRVIIVVCIYFYTSYSAILQKSPYASICRTFITQLIRKFLKHRTNLTTFKYTCLYGTIMQTIYRTILITQKKSYNIPISM